MDDDAILTEIIGEEHAGERLDVVLAKVFSDYSRSCLRNCIISGQVQVDGRILRPRDRVHGGARIVFTPPAEKVVEAQAQPLSLTVVHEDDDLLVVNKAAGMVTHPAPGHQSGTLLNGILHHCPSLVELPRAGIVHRLDKDTSGLLVIAKTHKSYKVLVEQLRQRSIERHYFAIVWGAVTTGGKIDVSLGRCPRDRKRVAVVSNGRSALTYYRVAERFTAHTALDVKLATGRTHQIRVHLSHIKHPVVGDTVYGGHFRAIVGWSEECLQELKQFNRQALHARRLVLTHPRTNEMCEWEVPLPQDILSILSLLRNESDAG